MRLAWGTNISGTGDAYGYAVHAALLYEALAQAGVIFDPEAELVLQMVPPHLFVPVPGRKTIVYTMWETMQVPGPMIANLQPAAMLLTPSQFSAEAFRTSGYQGPIRVCRLAVGPEHLAPVRPRADVPFRVLWVGAPNARKGWDLLGPAWRRYLSTRPSRPAELIVKTSSNNGEEFEEVHGGGTLRIMTKNLSTAEMVQLYRTAHVFVFPTRGEAWGATLLESMAAGCLALAPYIGGLREFFDDRVGWCLPWRRVHVNYGVPTTAYEVFPEALGDALARAVATYEDTEGFRCRARRRAEQLTWHQTAEQVFRAVEGVEGRRTDRAV